MILPTLSGALKNISRQLHQNSNTLNFLRQIDIFFEILLERLFAVFPKDAGS